MLANGILVNWILKKSKDITIVRYKKDIEKI
jgi:hypothetical protein